MKRLPEPFSQSPDQREGDVNTSENRTRWNNRNRSEASRELLERDERAFVRQSLSTPCLAAIVRAEGSWLEDLDGHRYLDFHGNSAHHLGYGHPRVVAAIEDPLHSLSFIPRRFTGEPTVTLAEKLGALVPGGQQWKVLLAPGGSQGVEIALQIARLAARRFKTISFWAPLTAPASAPLRWAANRIFGPTELVSC